MHTPLESGWIDRAEKLDIFGRPAYPCDDSCDRASSGVRSYETRIRPRTLTSYRRSNGTLIIERMVSLGGGEKCREGGDEDENEDNEQQARK